MLGLPLEGNGRVPKYFHLGGSSNIASTLCLNVTTALPITVYTSPLFEGTAGQTRTSHFLSIHTLLSSMPSPTGDASQQAAGSRQVAFSFWPATILPSRSWLSKLSPLVTSLYLRNFKKEKKPVVLFYVYECLVQMHVCVLCVCLAPSQARRRCQICCNWSYEWL